MILPRRKGWLSTVSGVSLLTEDRWVFSRALSGDRGYSDSPNSAQKKENDK